VIFILFQRALDRRCGKWRDAALRLKSAALRICAA
jgi:hypothetical protein